MLDRSISYFSPSPSASTVLSKLGITTAADLLALPPIRLLELKGTGPDRIEEIIALVRRVLMEAAVRPEVVRALRESPATDTGSVAADSNVSMPETAPSSVDELIRVALAKSRDSDRETLTARFLDRKSASDIAAEAGIAVGSVMDRVDRAISALRPVLQRDALRLVGGVLRAIREAGGFLGRDEVLRLVAAPHLGAIEFVASLAEDDRYSVWRDEFLTSLTKTERKLKFEAMATIARSAASWADCLVGSSPRFSAVSIAARSTRSRCRPFSPAC